MASYRLKNRLYGLIATYDSCHEVTLQYMVCARYPLFFFLRQIYVPPGKDINLYLTTIFNVLWKILISIMYSAVHVITKIVFLYL